MSEWKEAKPKYSRSKLIVPFCPFCGGEIDELYATNYADYCGCGEWSYNFGDKFSEGGWSYKPTVAKKEKKEKKEKKDGK